jgi:serine/threonine-protein kinase SRPK3
MVKDKQLKKSSSNGGILFYAIKVQKSAEHYTEAAMDEVELLDCIAKEHKRVEAAYNTTPALKDKDNVSLSTVVDHSRHVATLHDSFFHNGPHGKHMCMVFSMLGCNFLSVIKAYNYRGIPIPAVKKMMLGVAKGLDFLHRKCNIIHTDLKPENVLLQFPGQINTNGDHEDEDNLREDLDQDQSVSIQELESMLENSKISITERKRIRKKLKKRRQREKKRLDDDDDDNDDDDDDDDECQGARTFSDERMEHLLKQQDKKITKNAHERVLSRLSHSQFVMKNFCARVTSNGSELSGVIDDLVQVSRPSKSELASHFQICNSQVRKKSGVAEVSFLMRAFVPEQEIADNVSASLGSNQWEISDEEDAIREW